VQSDAADTSIQAQQAGAEKNVKLEPVVPINVVPADQPPSLHNALHTAGQTTTAT